MRLTGAFRFDPGTTGFTQTIIKGTWLEELEFNNNNNNVHLHSAETRVISAWRASG